MRDSTVLVVLLLVTLGTATAAPGQVTNVKRDGDSWVEGGRIHQPITWDEPQGTEDNEEPKTYVVRYKKTTPATGTDNMTTNTTETSLVLSLPLPQQAVTYIVSVAGKDGTGNGNFSDELTLNYSRPGTPTGVIVQAQSCVTLKVTWSSPDHTGGLPITGYNISYTDTRNNNGLYGYSNATVISLQQLKPGTQYIVRVRAMNAIGQGDFIQHSGRTSQRREGYMNVTANSAHSIRLSHSLTESRVYYVCNMTDVERGGKKAVNKIVLSRLATVTGLLPDTTYKVECVAYRSGEVEACLEVNITVTTRELCTFSDTSNGHSKRIIPVTFNERPDRVQNVIVRGSRVQSVHRNDSIAIIQTITWDAPPNHHNIQHYLIKYQMQGQPTSNETRTSSNATQASLVLLVPQGQTSTYSVWVAAVSQAGQGEVSDRVDFNYSKPDPPTGVKSVNSTCNSITLTWSPPHYTGGVPLEGYAVRWSGRGSPLRTDGPDVTAVTVTRLSPNTLYTIDVRAVNAIGERQRGKFKVNTKPQVKMVISLHTISSRSVHFSTKVSLRLETVEVKCNLSVKENSSYIQTRTLDDRTHEGAAQGTVDNLVPYTNYTATCLVFQDGVDQCYIGSDTTQTYTDKPDAPPQEVYSVSTSSHSFTMTWAPPPKGQQNGEIVSYEVEYREEGSNSTVVNTTRGMRYTSEDLTTDRVYQFRVAANTVNGTGPFAEWENVTTIPIATNLKVVNTTTSSATITWDQPPHNYRVFLHGEATDNIPQSRVIQVVNVTGQTTHTVEGLDSFRNYSISVFLASDNGIGTDATVIVTTTGRAPDGSPTHLTATPTSRSVTLQWSPPPVLSRNGILTHYVVGLANETWNTTQSHSITGEQRKRREADSEGVGEETQSLTVEHLRPFTNYSWEVAAVSGFGTGPLSDRRRFETDQDVPTQVEDITVNPGNKTITWAAPVEPNGIIVGYRVQYWELGRRDTTEEVNTTQDEMISYSHFRAGVPHKVQVQAATVAGLGESRVVEEVLFSEEQVPTTPVSDITVTRINEMAVRVTWTALTLNEARGFPSYVVSVTSRCEQVSSQRTPSTSVVVGGLMPHTEYNVTVQALTAGGTKEGPHSAPVTLQKIPFVQPEPTPEQSATAATIGGFVGGTVFGVLVTLLVVGIVMGAVRMARKETGRRKHSAAVDASACLAPDATPMDANPSYEEVHVYEHVDKKDSKQ